MQPNSNDVLFHNFRRQFSVSAQDIAILEARVGKGQSPQTESDEDAHTQDGTITSNSDSSSSKDKSWIKGLRVLERRQKARGVKDASIYTEGSPTLMTYEDAHSRASWTAGSHTGTSSGGDNQSKTLEGDDEASKATGSTKEPTTAKQPANFLGQMMDNLSLGISTSNSSGSSADAEESGQEIVNVMKNSAYAPSKNLGGSFDMIHFTDIKKHESTEESLESSTEYVPRQNGYRDSEDNDVGIEQVKESSDDGSIGLRDRKYRRQWSKRKAKASRSIKRSKAKLVESMRIKIEKSSFGKLKRRNQANQTDHPDPTDTVIPFQERMKALTHHKLSRISSKGLPALSLKRLTNNYKKIANLNSTGSVVSEKKTPVKIERRHLNATVAPLNQYMRRKSQEYKHSALCFVSSLRRSVKGKSNGRGNSKGPEMVHSAIADEQEYDFVSKEGKTEMKLGQQPTWAQESTTRLSPTVTVASVDGETDTTEAAVEADALGPIEEKFSSVQKTIDDSEPPGVEVSKEAHLKEEEEEGEVVLNNGFVLEKDCLDEMVDHSTEVIPENKATKTMPSSLSKKSSESTLKYVEMTEKAQDVGRTPECGTVTTNSSPKEYPEEMSTTEVGVEVENGVSTCTTAGLQEGVSTQGECAHSPSKDPLHGVRSNSGECSENKTESSLPSLKIIQRFNSSKREVSEKLEVERILSGTEPEGNGVSVQEVPKECIAPPESGYDNTKSPDKSKLPKNGRRLKNILKNELPKTKETTATPRAQKNCNAPKTTAKAKTSFTRSGEGKSTKNAITVRRPVTTVVQKSKKLFASSKPDHMMQSQPEKNIAAVIVPVPTAESEKIPRPNGSQMPKSSPGDQSSPSNKSMSRVVSSSVVDTTWDNVEMIAGTGNTPEEITKLPSETIGSDFEKVELSEQKQLPHVIQPREEKQNCGQSRDNSNVKQISTPEKEGSHEKPKEIVTKRSHQSNDVDKETCAVDDMGGKQLVSGAELKPTPMKYDKKSSLLADMSSSEESVTGATITERNEESTSRNGSTGGCIFPSASQLVSIFFHKGDGDDDWVHECVGSFDIDDDEVDTLLDDADYTQASSLIRRPGKRISKKTHIPFIDDETALKKASSDDSSVSNPALMNQLFGCNGVCSERLITVESDVSSVSTHSGITFESTVADKHSGTDIVLGRSTRGASGTEMSEMKNAESSDVPSQWVEVREQNANQTSCSTKEEEIQKKPKRGVKKRILSLVQRKGKAGTRSRHKENPEKKEQTVQNSESCTKSGGDLFEPSAISFLSEPSASLHSWTNNSDVFSGVGSAGGSRRCEK